MSRRKKTARRSRGAASDDSASNGLRFLPQHAALLRASGVTEGVAKERGYRSARSARSLATLGFSRPQRRAPALLVPVRGPSGRETLVRLRPDLPRVRFGVPIEFESPHRARRTLDVPPRCRAALADASVPLHVVASPLAADATAARGLCAVAIAGPGRWRDARGEPLADWDAIELAGREVRIVLESPSAARPHARGLVKALAAFLTGRGAKVHVHAPRLDEKAGGLPSRAADALIAIGGRVELFHDERREPYAVLPGDAKAPATAAGRRAVRVRGREFRMWLRHALYRETRIGAQDGALSAAVEVLAARALFEGSERTVPLRFAGAPPELWIDLADDSGRAVRVTSRGAEVVAAPPVLFRRFSHQLALPAPARARSSRSRERAGALLAELSPFLNLAHPEDALLVQAWLVTALLPHVPCPALCLHGPQGSAKTTQARWLRGLLDPSSVLSLDLGQGGAELAQLLAHHAVPFFDNLSRLSQRQADFLCRAVTGGGFSKRELYSDDDDVLFDFRRPILMTGVNVPAAQPDLLDRLLLIELNAIAPEQRRPEQELRAKFEAARPKILAALFATLSRAMAIEPEVKLGRSPRMADFARWGAAAAIASGSSAKEFEEALERNADRQAQVVVEGNDLVEAIGALVKKAGGSWKGMAKELFEKISAGRTRATKGKDWPVNAWSLSQRLTELEVPLRRVGIDVRREWAHGGRRTIRLEAAPPAPPVNSDGIRGRMGGSRAVGRVGRRTGNRRAGSWRAG